MPHELTTEELDDQSLRQEYLEHISAYEKAFKTWSSRVDKIIQRYRDEKRSRRDKTAAKFNILWANVQTLVPATFSQLPQPDVTRRFRDQDPVGRVASLLLERCLDYEVQHYPDYRATLKADVYDRFLGGRGQAWVRYEPHFKDLQTPMLGGDEGGEEEIPREGLQISEDSAEPPVQEELDYECAPLDYVHWKDFGHEVARTWEEVTKVWRKVYLDEDAVIERFGDEVAKKLPYDATPEDKDRSYAAKDSKVRKQALIYELWDKSTGEAVWFSKSQNAGFFLDRLEDPLGLQEFYPCPCPLYATITNDSLIPVPDFILYQDQAKELDILADRVRGLAEMLQVKGVYDASCDAVISRLFTEGTNGSLLPVKNWAAFAEKNGLKGAVDVLDLDPIAHGLDVAYKAMFQAKDVIYEITGIADIIRGITNPNETLGAQEIKENYAGLRLKAMQDDVARFATDCLRLKAQIMCAKFSPKTLLAMAAAEQMSQQDQQLIQPHPMPLPPEVQQQFEQATQQAQQQGQPPPPPPQPQINPGALALLIGEERLKDPDADSPNPLRSFRIEIAADTLVKLNEQVEQKARIAFLKAVGLFMKEALPVAQAQPELLPMLVEMLKFGITSFKVGKQIEGVLDESLEKLRQAAGQPQPPPPPDPAIQVEQMKQQGAQAKSQAERQLKQVQIQAEDAASQRQLQKDVQREELDRQSTERIEQGKIASEEKLALIKINADRDVRLETIRTTAACDLICHNKDDRLERDKLAVTRETRDLERMDHEALEKREDEHKTHEHLEHEGEEKAIDALTDVTGDFAKATNDLADAVKIMADAQTGEKTLIRDKEGKVTGIKSG